MSTSQADVLIVGAGIAGLMAASVLAHDGLSVIVVEKGRDVGGRMATRRIGPGRADYGAQFFTVRDDRFGRLVQDWLDRGLVRQWATGWSNSPTSSPFPDGHPRYVGSSGMTTVPQFLADGLDVHKGVKLVGVTAVFHTWHCTDESGHQFHSRALLMTPPAPQSLALLNAGSVPLHPLDRQALARISYAPSIAAIFWIEGGTELPTPGAIQRPDQPFPWIADNRRKGISPDATLITVHAHPEMSLELWDADNSRKVAAMQAGLQPFMIPDTIIKEVQIHRWRYAIPIILHPERTLLARNLPPLTFAGDGFKEARVEGAALSGLAAAEKLKQSLSS